MAPTADHATGPGRLAFAIGILLAFNAIAIALVLAVGLPAPPWVFAAWFVGDVVAGLIALGLTERW